MTRAPSKDSDQPGHLPSLNRVFAVRMKKHWALNYLLSAQWRLWSDWADAQADLILRWVHMSFCWFCRAVAQVHFALHFLSILVVTLFLISFALCTYQCFPPERSVGVRDYPWELEKFEDLVSNSLPMSHRFVSKISWMCHKIYTSCLMTKPTKWLWTRQRLGSAWESAQSDQSSQFAQWVAKDPSFLHVDSEDSDQTGWMPRLIWVFTGHTVLLVLSWDDSFVTYFLQDFLWYLRYHSCVKFPGVVIFLPIYRPPPWYLCCPPTLSHIGALV